jgi:uncharacterized protein YdaU (DUF1376 family)
MSLAYFPMYPGDFDADTAHLTLAEDGAYNRLLRLCWRTPGCSIPADREWIYRRMRATSTEDQAVVDSVLQEFFVVADGRASNARLSKEWLAANQAHERRVLAGSKGGRAKSLKTCAASPSNAKAKPKQPEPEPEIKSGGDDSARAREAGPSDQTDRERLLVAMGHDPSGITAAGRIVGNPGDMAEAARWTALGLTREQQAAVIAEVMTRKRDGPPISFSYFTAAMQRRAGELAKPPLQPTETRDTGETRNGRSSRGSEFLDAFIAGARSAS